MLIFNSIFFDLDGTLLDTADDLGAALNYVLSCYQYQQVTPERYTPIASDGATGLLKLGFGDDYNRFDALTLRKQFLDYYLQNIAVHTKIYPGLENLITYLNQQHIPWGIITNKPIALTRQLLTHFNSLAQAPVILGGDSLSKRKPDPLPLHYACQQLNQSPETALYVGDAQRDIEAANRAGMTSCIAAWGYIKASDDLSAWHADHTCNQVDQFTKFIGYL